MEDRTEELMERVYDEYALPHESMEDTCNRLADQLGEDYIYLLTRKTTDK